MLLVRVQHVLTVYLVMIQSFLKYENQSHEKMLYFSELVVILYGESYKTYTL